MKPEFSVVIRGVFRGQRDYFHSTDLYDELVGALYDRGVEVTSLDIKIKQKITSVPQVDFFRDELDDANTQAAAFAKFKSKSGTWLAVVSQGVEPITNRKPYNEAPVWGKITRNDAQFELTDCHSYSPIEIVTATAVHAHKTLLPPPIGERWLLAQIMADRLLGNTELEFFKIDIARRLGPKMTQSNMLDKTGIFGKMIFILK